MAFTAALRNFKETGSFFNIRQWPLFTENIYELAVSDALMCASTAASLPLHSVFKRSTGWLRWRRGGMGVQSVYQVVWLGFWCGWPFVRDWTWTAQVFFTLHLLALFMKMHSYAFYNGHLSTTLERLQELDDPVRAKTPTTEKAVRYPHSQSFEHMADTAALVDGSGSGSGDLDDTEQEEISPLEQLRADLATELTSPMGRVTYPQNLTLSNYFDYLLCPTLCYELEYPRLDRTNPLELFYKTLAVFGCIFLMTIVSEEFIIPVLDSSSHLLQQPTLTFPDRALIFAETVSHLLFPFMVTFLLVFLVIFEYVLGAFAEITRFADRRFYADWWNSLDWLEFSREWNIPVHHFFRRHVYSASRASMSRPFATVTTFLISSLAHELVMGCITRKFRGYGFSMMMLQMPIVMVQRLPWVRKRRVVNNVLFWCSMILGLSLVSPVFCCDDMMIWWVLGFEQANLLTILRRCVRFTCLFRIRYPLWIDAVCPPRAPEETPPILSLMEFNMDSSRSRRRTTMTYSIFSYFHVNLLVPACLIFEEFSEEVASW
jgi:sterol O-acyltransferase